MQISRRGFLKGVAASAVLSGSHVLGLASRAWAAGAAGAPVLVLVNLAGGNDLLNTVIPLDDVGAPQRSLYQQLRPDLALPLASLATMTVHPDPVLGTGLALHPSLSGLKQLYDQGRVALVLGAGIAGNSLSHFEAEKAWFFGRPDVLAETTGWVGRQLDLAPDGLPHAVSFGGGVSPVFEAELADALGLRSVDGFALPDDPWWEWRDGVARGAALREILAESRSGVAERAARSGRMLIEQTEFLSGIPTTGWGSTLEAEAWGPGRDLREIASLLRHDTLNPGAATGFGFYHLRIPGYDTHSRQGALDPNATHPALLSNLSRWLHGFQQDLDAIGASHRVLTVVYSEFGRRAAQNATGADAGTDHGAGGLMLLLGDRAVGGVHGRMPRLDQLDATGSLAVTTDFRTVYAALIDDFLGGDHALVLPGAPFGKLPVIQAA
jgi:uncharacterized protein (DUF1501 family)